MDRHFRKSKLFILTLRSVFIISDILLLYFSFSKKHCLDDNHPVSILVAHRVGSLKVFRILAYTSAETGDPVEISIALQIGAVTYRGQIVLKIFTDPFLPVMPGYRSISC
jgi:hypothetical protein